MMMSRMYRRVLIINTSKDSAGVLSLGKIKVKIGRMQVEFCTVSIDF